MCGHDSCHLGSHSRPEWEKFHRFQVAEIVGYCRKSNMWIHTNIAVAGEVFAKRQHSFSLHGLDKRDAKCSNPPWIAVKRAGADHRVGWVVVHIEHRGEVDIDAYGSQLS